jgi:acylphosphatase
MTAGVCKKVYLSGKVQGVSFRFHAHEQASALKLKGWVRNLHDGRVELVLAGPASDVEAVIRWARKGPPTAEVEKVEIQEADLSVATEAFFIRRDGGK